MFLWPVWDKTLRTTALGQGWEASKKATHRICAAVRRTCFLVTCSHHPQAAVTRRPNAQRNRGHPSSGMLGG